MNFHTVLSDELLEKNSIGAFVWLIDHGREIEFKYKEQEYFVTTEDEDIVLWHDYKKQSFSCMEEMFEEVRLCDEDIYEVWDDVEFTCIF